MSPQEDLGSAIGGGQIGAAIGGSMADSPVVLLSGTTEPVPPVTPPPTPGTSVDMYRVTSQSAGTVDVTEGALLATISGSFPSVYSPSLVTSWATDKFVLNADKSAGSFVARFNIPPPASATLDWAVGGA